MATVGGNLFAPYPYGDFAVALLALGATVTVEDARRDRDHRPRSIPRQTRTTAPAASSAPSASRFLPPAPSASPRSSAASRTAPRSCRSRRCCRWRAEGRPARASPMARWRRRPMRARAVEKALEGKPLDAAAIAAAVEVATEGCAPLSDPQASAWYRLNVLPVHLQRLLGWRGGADRWRAFPLTFTVNGAEQAEFVEPGALLVDVLRDKLGLTATKVGCGQGTCGACTVHDRRRAGALLPRPGASASRARRSRRWRASSPNGALHPLQRAFADGFAAQCGFCTSGMIIAAKALLDRNPDPTAPTWSTRSPATSAAAPATSRSSTPSSSAAADMRAAEVGLRETRDGTRQGILRRRAHRRLQHHRRQRAARRRRSATSPAGRSSTPTATSPACCT